MKKHFIFFIFVILSLNSLCLSARTSELKMRSDLGPLDRFFMEECKENINIEKSFLKSYQCNARQKDSDNSENFLFNSKYEDFNLKLTQVTEVIWLKEAMNIRRKKLITHNLTLKDLIKNATYKKAKKNKALKRKASLFNLYALNSALMHKMKNNKWVKNCLRGKELFKQVTEKLKTHRGGHAVRANKARLKAAKGLIKDNCSYPTKEKPLVSIYMSSVEAIDAIKQAEPFIQHEKVQKLLTELEKNVIVDKDNHFYLKKKLEPNDSNFLKTIRNVSGDVISSSQSFINQYGQFLNSDDASQRYSEYKNVSDFLSKAQRRKASTKEINYWKRRLEKEKIRMGQNLSDKFSDIPQELYNDLLATTDPYSEIYGNHKNKDNNNYQAFKEIKCRLIQKSKSDKRMDDIIYWGSIATLLVPGFQGAAILNMARVAAVTAGRTRGLVAAVQTLKGAKGAGLLLGSNGGFYAADLMEAENIKQRCSALYQRVYAPSSLKEDQPGLGQKYEECQSELSTHMAFAKGGLALGLFIDFAIAGKTAVQILKEVQLPKNMNVESKVKLAEVHKKLLKEANKNYKKTLKAGMVPDKKALKSIKQSEAKEKTQALALYLSNKSSAEQLSILKSGSWRGEEGLKEFGVTFAKTNAGKMIVHHSQTPQLILKEEKSKVGILQSLIAKLKWRHLKKSAPVEYYDALKIFDKKSERDVGWKILALMERKYPHQTPKWRADKFKKKAVSCK